MIVFRCVIFQVVICCTNADGEAKPKISFPFLPLRGGGVGGGDARKM